MSFVSVTRLRIRSVFFLPGFLKANEASVRSLVASPGFIAGGELTDKGFTFWTLTVWDSIESMKGFRNGEAHRVAMRKLPGWCSEASYAHWEQEGGEFPGWLDASKRLLAEGRLTKVRHPSARQQEGLFPPLKWTKFERRFKKR
ncbi:MAG TPA: DUF3291 domain-containing protein [Chitinophagaceae bacterium]|jgi:hypothetical protein